MMMRDVDVVQEKIINEFFWYKNIENCLENSFLIQSLAWEMLKNALLI